MAARSPCPPWREEKRGRQDDTAGKVAERGSHPEPPRKSVLCSSWHTTTERRRLVLSRAPHVGDTPPQPSQGLEAQAPVETELSLGFQSSGWELQTESLPAHTNVRPAQERGPGWGGRGPGPRVRQLPPTALSPSRSVIIASCLFLSLARLLDFSSSSMRLVVNSAILSSRSFFSCGGEGGSELKIS